MHRQILTVLLTILIGLATACGNDETPTPTAPTVTPPTPPVTPPPTSPTLTDLSLLGPTWFVDNPVLEIGETVQLSLEAEYSDGSTESVTEEATWTSSNDHVATVIAGLVTGRNLGGANVRAQFEDLDVRSVSFQVERGAHVTVRNVRKERSSSSFERVKGTVINTGSKSMSGFLEMHARFWSSGGLLLSENRDYVEAGGTFTVDAQRTFDILVRNDDIRGWSYYTLAFTDDDEQQVECSGCDERRR